MASNLPKTYTAAVFETQNSGLTVKEVPLKQPAPGQVLVKVLACGVCHSDAHAQDGNFGSPFPLVPGHEVVGDVVVVGSSVTQFKDGDRVGVAWVGGFDKTCDLCQAGLPQACKNGKFTGISVDGGYAEYALVQEEAVVRVPATADPIQVAPLLCAGVTVFNGIRKLQLEQGGLVAVQGLGGLGHLAVQYARKMGYRVAAISRGGGSKDKEAFAKKLGAHIFIDTTATPDVAKELNALGGADAIISTAPDAASISPLAWGLAPRGKLLLLAPIGPVSIDSIALLSKCASVVSWHTGDVRDCEQAIAFAELNDIRCMVEPYPLQKAPEAFSDMLQGKPRFRAVLKM